jgi:hypothetical protein
MSLLDSIVNASVTSAMINSRALSLTSELTLTQVGSSLPKIRYEMLQATRGARFGKLPHPIVEMRDYALAQTKVKNERTAIKNAALKAFRATDTSFQNLVGPKAYSFLDVQNAAGEALSSGITSFISNLKDVDPSIIEGLITVGNKSLPNARQMFDEVALTTYSIAEGVLSEKCIQISDKLIDTVITQNLATITPTSTTTTSSSSGIYVGSEGTQNTLGNNTTDVVYQNIKIYIEGVQVPFEQISISQSMGNLPTAFFAIPPQAGLMDIARYYQPKVHIFFTDNNLGGDRLLFWGHIVAPNYTKSRSAGSATIGFQCVHKNALVGQLTLDYTGYVSNATTNVTNPNDNSAVVKINDMNSTLRLIDALKGITGMQTDSKDLLDPSNTDIAEADVTMLSQRWLKYQNRYIGMPAGLMNMWNQMKKACYQSPYLNSILSSIYIPLLEDGIGFFDRISGHYYLENIIQTSKQPYCAEAGTSNSASTTVAMVPPAYRLPSITAMSTTMSVEVISNMLGFSGELTDFAQLFNQFYLSFEYEMITLASPASVPVDPTVTINPDSASAAATTEMMAVETIIKPSTPFYYSPMCNVLLPKMYSDISIEQREDVIPTRITAFHPALPVNSQGMGTNYRGPNSIREAAALGAALIQTDSSSSSAGAPTTPAASINLTNTTAQDFNIPGKYEQGRGIKPMKIAMPQWLAQLAMGRTADTDPTQEAWPAQGTADYTALLNLYAAWVDRYGYDITVDSNGNPQKVRNTNKDVLNPYSTQAGIAPFQRLLFSAVDYEYTKQVAQSRSGMISAIFNPYIIPGYPMDVLADSPNDPSFHGVCSSVTHTITSRSIETTIGIVSAMSYSEMSNYYIQPLHPWLQTALNMLTVTYGSTSNAAPSGYDSSETYADTSATTSDSQEYGDVSNVTAVRQTLIGNTAAASTATQFYQSVLGIGAAAPDVMYDFGNGVPIPLTRSSGAWSTGTTTSLPLGNGGEGNDYMTAMGNLRLVSRPIEGKNAIQAKYGVSFIDMTPANYGSSTQSSAPQYQNPILSADLLLEPGASLFLDYDEVDDFINEGWSGQS